MCESLLSVHVRVKKREAPFGTYIFMCYTFNESASYVQAVFASRDLMIGWRNVTCIRWWHHICQWSAHVNPLQGTCIWRWVPRITGTYWQFMVRILHTFSRCPFKHRFCTENIDFANWKPVFWIHSFSWRYHKCRDLSTVKESMLACWQWSLTQIFMWAMRQHPNHVTTVHTWMRMKHSMMLLNNLTSKRWWQHIVRTCFLGWIWQQLGRCGDSCFEGCTASSRRPK